MYSRGSSLKHMHIFTKQSGALFVKPRCKNFFMLIRLKRSIGVLHKKNLFLSTKNRGNSAKNSMQKLYGHGDTIKIYAIKKGSYEPFKNKLCLVSGRCICGHKASISGAVVDHGVNNPHNWRNNLLPSHDA